MQSKLLGQSFQKRITGYVSGSSPHAALVTRRTGSRTSPGAVFAPRLTGKVFSKSPVVVNAASAPPEQGEREAPPKEEEVEVEGVDALRITPNITVLRGICNKRLKFDIEYSRKRGTTDNTYLIKVGKSGHLLVDVSDQAFTKQWVKTLQGTVPIESISSLVITHLTPRRVNSLKAFLSLRGQVASGKPKLEVHLSNPALQSLRSILGKDEEGSSLLNNITLVTATSGSSLAVGRNDALRLIPAPTPRWPDLLCAYHAGDRMLLTSKLFSAHVSPTAAGGSPEDPFDTGGWEAYEQDWKFFFECMLAPVARQASGALSKLDVISAPAFGRMSVMEALRAGLRSAQEKLEGGQKTAFGGAMGRPDKAMVVAGLCPIHGPVARSATTELIYKYREWTDQQIKSSETCNVAVMYASAYGNTASLAQAISRGVTKAGVGVETLNLETCSLEEVNQSISKSSGFVIGSPTLGGHMPTQVATTLGAVLRNEKAKSQMCGVFGSFGWSGEAVDEMEGRLKDAGFRFAFDSLRVKFKPSAADMQKAEESGTDLAQALLKKQKKEEKRTSSQARSSGTGGETEQAVGRLIGSMCAVTARDEDAQSAMLASWISQASFNPPGLTVAVKKDRAVENLMNNGSQFVVNILAEGDHKPLMKQLTKRFKPGEDRFAGLDIQESEGNGGVVLPGAASYLDCTVQDRMEAGDHYIVYARVDSGKVVDPNALSAVHHRKTGTNY